MMVLKKGAKDIKNFWQEYFFRRIQWAVAKFFKEQGQWVGGVDMNATKKDNDGKV